jgi:hypothetical protein
MMPAGVTRFPGTEKGSYLRISYSFDMILKFSDKSTSAVSGKRVTPAGIIPFHCLVMEMSAERSIVGFVVGSVKGHQTRGRISSYNSLENGLRQQASSFHCLVMGMSA